MKKMLSSAILVSLFLSSTMWGQSTNASISGFVQDSSQAFLPGVTVTATNTRTEVSTSSVSNEAGAYTILSLLPGTYRLSAMLPGFKTVTINNVALGSGASIRNNFTLEVGQV